MKADEYQDEVCGLLKQLFDEGDVKKEWSIWAGAGDTWKNRDTYAPRLDVAVGPFNLTSENKEGDISKIYDKSGTPLMQAIVAKYKEQNSQDIVFNVNPRCLLAIEVEFSGSSKHILGDYANASMMGLAGVVVSNFTNDKKPNYSKIERVSKYVQEIRGLGKAPSDMFANTVYFGATEFLDLLGSLAH